MKGGRRQGRQRKRWEESIREWTGLEFGKSRGAVEKRGKWRELVVKSSLVPQRPLLLRDRWRWRKQMDLCVIPCWLFFLFRCYGLLPLSCGFSANRATSKWLSVLPIRKQDLSGCDSIALGLAFPCIHLQGWQSLPVSVWRQVGADPSSNSKSSALWE